MTSTVLLTLDRSDKDARAIPVAQAFAALTDADIHVLHVLGGIPGVPPAELTAGAADREAQARRWLDDVRNHVTAPAGRRVTVELVISLGYAETILAIANERQPEVVIVATRAPGSVERAVYGSVADRLVRESPQPIVVVPPGAEGERRGSHLSPVLVPLDESRDALRIVDRLLSYARASTLHFVLVQVVRAEPTGGYLKPPPSILEVVNPDSHDDGLIHVHAEAAKGALNEIADHIRARGASVEARVVESTNPEVAIVDTAGTESAGLIAMTTRGESGLTRFLAGSVADGVMRRSTVPVLIIAQQAPAAS